MIDLQRAIVYDIEVFPNAFTINAEGMFDDTSGTLMISEYRDDRAALFAWFDYLHQKQIPMIGFNSLGYDYNVLHDIFKNPQISYQQIYQISKSIIDQPFGTMRRTVFPSDRFAPQIDLFKVSHFDNKAKSTSLKALEVNMRSHLVLESKLDFDKPLTADELFNDVIPYNVHDVKETKKFAHHSLAALQFRIGLMDTLNGDVLNFNDTKIGAKILEQRLGDDICFEYQGNRKVTRQTPRSRIALKDIIFPYIQFSNPEFQRVLEYMRAQVLTPEDLDDPDAVIKTKGVFSGIKADVGGVEFKFGTGGIHGSVLSRVFHADAEWLLRDIDVASLYPNIAIKNRLAPAHMGERFVEEYARLPEERKRFQKEFGKKSIPANSMKLASNGTYGNTNNKFSPFYDPQLTMTITINGQLMLCMLAEWLLTVPTLQLIQINTDGITYRIHAPNEPAAAAICAQWEAYTLLTLESVNYRSMWIRDVNSYVALDVDGNLKVKGAYWAPDAGEGYARSISETQPPSWHKDLSACVVQRAAVAALTRGIDPELYIRTHGDPFDFMLREKVSRADRLLIGDRETQRISRYYIALDGAPMRKISPPAKGAQIGDFKRASKITDVEFNRVMAEIGPGVHDERIHTKNKSRYEMRETAVQAGWKVAECNVASDFRFDNLNYAWYIAEARKLMLG